ncbi:MAG: adenylate/guanylate cyclase domain-containing protein [bacterium]|nr:adenylate/guanylate cyclase domain-containing protein [bacterium]
MNTIDSPIQSDHKHAISAEDLLHQYRYAIDQSTILSKTDPRGFITYANDEFCRVAQFRLDELIGQRHNIVRHPAMPSAAFHDLWNTIKTAKVWNGIIQNQAKDGSSYWVKTTVIPIVDGEGIIREHIAIRDDITELINLQDRLERMLHASERFVPTEFLRLLERENIAEAQLGDSRLVGVTVLFADIRGFTGMSEQQAPDAVMQELNRFYSHVTPAIANHGGVIDKYIGDAIMALFPDANQALQAARAMLGGLTVYNQERRQQDLLPYRIGIGLHSGQVILGTVGSEKRFSTTILGDAVNVAARLEQSTKQVEYDVLVSEETVRMASFEEGLKRLGKLRLRGRQEPVTVYGLR